MNISEVRNYALKSEKTVFTIGSVGRISFQKNPELFNDIAQLFPNSSATGILQKMTDYTSIPYNIIMFVLVVALVAPAGSARWQP